MNYRQLVMLTLVACSSFLESGCSKNLAISAMPMAPLVEKQGDNTRPLYLVNNVEVNDLKQASINPNDIESINVMKPSTTTNLVDIYGPKAKNGVVFIKTKKIK